jgi:hypothetical protein
MLADGNFQFEGAEDFLRPPAAMVAIRRDRGRGCAAFELVGNAFCEADGLWSADRLVHSLALQTTVPPLEELLDFPSFWSSSERAPSAAVRFELSARHSSFARVVANSVFRGDGGSDALMGDARSMVIEVRRNADALEFAIEARVDEPQRRDVRAAPFTVRVRANLSFATMALAGSTLWWRGGSDIWKSPAADQFGPLAQVLTLDRAGGTPYFRGTLDLGPGQSPHTRGPWVKAWLSEHRLRLTPHRDFTRSQGFVGGDNYGPDLVFENLGTTAWAEMLAVTDDVLLEQAGAGIGHVQGVTGRDVGDYGPHIQSIAAVRTRLSRSQEGLRITFDGELGELRQGGVQAPLGPHFTGDFLIPTAFLFARGIRLRDQWLERQRRFAKG